jgi:hypothetical protein
LVLAAIGLYRVVRTRSGGEQMNLVFGWCWAQRGDLLRMVFGAAAGSVGGGVLAGVVLAFRAQLDFFQMGGGEGARPRHFVRANGFAGVGGGSGVRDSGAPCHGNRFDDGVALRLNFAERNEWPQPESSPRIYLNAVPIGGTVLCRKGCARRAFSFTEHTVAPHEFIRQEKRKSKCDTGF